MNYSNTDDFDLAIADFVSTGLCDRERLIKQADILQAAYDSGDIKGKFDAIWRAYWDTLQDNSVEIRDSFIRHFEQHSEYHNLRELDTVVRLFRKLGFEYEADNLIQTFVRSRSDEPKVFDLESMQLAGEIQDQKVIEAANRTYNDNKPPLTLEGVLEAIAKKNECGQYEIEFLASRSEDDFYALFMGTQGEMLTPYIATCLGITRYVSPDENTQKIVLNASNALRRSAREIPMNKLRLAHRFERHKLSLDDPPNADDPKNTAE